MSEPQGETPLPAEVPAPEPIRVLLTAPIGTLALEVTGMAVTRLVISPSPGLRKELIPLRKIRDSEFLDEVVGRLSEYFAGARRNLDLDWDLGPSGADSFARRIYKETAKTPYGRTRTYKEIAEAAGRPEAYRQVLSTLLANPIPILIPCHRIVPGKAGIGSYVGGERRKRWLLRLERQTAAGS